MVTMCLSHQCDLSKIICIKQFFQYTSFLLIKKKKKKNEEKLAFGIRNIDGSLRFFALLDTYGLLT